MWLGLILLAARKTKVASQPTTLPSVESIWPVVALILAVVTIISLIVGIIYTLVKLSEGPEYNVQYITNNVYIKQNVYMNQYVYVYLTAPAQGTLQPSQCTGYYFKGKYYPPSSPPAELKGSIPMIPSTNVKLGVTTYLPPRT